ncbi:unnamed protein product, partial [Vitis vinifera]
MSLIPSVRGGGRWSSIFDPFSLDLWDPFEGFPEKSPSNQWREELPENAKIDEVKASMENDVLTVTVPKKEVKKVEVKAIEISS